MKKLLLACGCVALVAIVVLVAAIRHSKPPVATESRPTKSYVALGDSVAAGVGLKDDSDSSACDRTNQAYPNLVAVEARYRLKNLACSGATLAAGIIGAQDVNRLMVAPQIRQLFGQPKPELITITIGANDAHWSTVLASCYTGQCGSAADTSAVSASLKTAADNLRLVLVQIQDHYKTSPPPVLVTGYHQVFPTSAPASCTDLAGIDSGELAWGRQLQTTINDSLKQALGGYGFASFVPVDFSGHELCTTDPWVQGISDKQPYHPTADGQAAFAKAIIGTGKVSK